MAQASTERQEYWRPANPDVAWIVAPQPPESLCWNCGIEYSPAARFCHMCGCSRDPGPHTAVEGQRSGAGLRKADKLVLPWRRSLPLLSFICFVLGTGCVIGAGLMSVIYRTDTLVDWQAVQIWRIEWLLSAVAAFLAGVLLKKAR
jgi:hypothetical protein